MPIVSANIKADARPAEGWGMVVAEFVWHDGALEPAVFESHSSEDLQQRLASMVAQREADRAASEVGTDLNEVIAIGSLATITKTAQTLEAIREAYALSRGFVAVMIGDYLSSLTNAELMTLFNKTHAQVVVLRHQKFTPAKNLASAIRASAGT